MNSETPTKTPTVLGEFKQLFTPSRRGARLARRAVARRLHDWGVPRGGDVYDNAVQVVAELVTNAATHGYVYGHSFLLKLVWATGTVRIEVADACEKRRPRTRRPEPDAESGRGLLIVEALADRWGVEDRDPGKTVWAELDTRPEPPPLA
ncbi:ATP-binding protein [Streptomyces ipomoeae]|uniref:ATP-binding protein n=1 Tax=Streptomyces ipomoeae TaxID=103232 RepID=UPI0029A6E82A|nr:ATP-binding protein [Streptomyces ipomoeae]MDX2698993.1 ATP-binding protein [Streptomyces ipomoeae]MDX2844620.1 ATP-binding protein [Streptomyces ipomoeae]